MSSRHLILGGAGFIGRHVAILLARQGHTVVLADRNQPTWAVQPDLQSRITWVRFEFASADWARLTESVDVVHHYAWTSIPATANANPAGDLGVNVIGTLGLLEVLRHRPGIRLVFSSSGGTVYGKLNAIPVPEEHPLRPVTAYGAGKATAEVYLQLYHALHGVDCRIARIANPYGAGQDFTRGQGAATTFLHKALTRETIAIWGDGEIVRDYVHIADLADALLLLSQATLPAGTNTFNIGSGEGVSLNAVVTEIERHFGRALDIRREPARSFDLPVSVLDIGRARDVLGWSPRISFKDGMKRTIEDLANGSDVSRVNDA